MTGRQNVARRRSRHATYNIFTNEVISQFDAIGDVSLYLHLGWPRAPRRTDGGSLGSVSYWQIWFSHVSDALSWLLFALASANLHFTHLFCGQHFSIRVFSNLINFSWQLVLHPHICPTLLIKASQLQSWPAA